MPAIWPFSKLFALSAVAAASAVGASATPTTVSGRAHIHDGDTIMLEDRLSGRVKVRVWGIDAPELTQVCADGQGRAYACGRLARDRLAALIAGDPVHCAVRDVDRYKRLVATCAVTAARDIGAWMVGEGWALDYTRYSAGAYLPLAQQAERDRRGIWMGRFDNPATVRHR